MSRPANGNVYAITKLPNRKSASEEKEAMNCKSCRKRKIKCSRTRPKCNSCEVFHCECIYDAVPRKRGPKTELLEDLLRRIGHLEKRLEDGKSGSGEDEKTSDDASAPTEANGHASSITLVTPPSATTTSSSSHPTLRDEPGLKHEEDVATMEQEIPELAPTPISLDMDANFLPHLVDVYFNRVNKKPYSYIHEKTFRSRIQDGSIPQHLLNAICATSIRYTLPPAGKTLTECTERFATLARNQVDADEPSVDNLLTLILLSDVYFALGHGKKSFMQLGSAIRMALALELHRELPPNSPATPIEREVRRRCFWTCYLMDRFAVCGSNRPPLISDCTIKLRLPCSESYFRSGKPSEESLFSEDGFGQQFGNIPISRNTNAMLVEIVRILGKTVLYIQQGGVKGDSHFPWHSSSNLSMIRNELKVWAGYFENKAQEKASFPSGSEATVFYLSKAAYHLIHCLMYRTFLPIDLKEINGTGTQQAWQQEATNMCLQHAKALTDLAHQAANTPSIEWPAFMSYCLTSAATVHLHGTQYTGHALSEGSREALLKVIKFLIRMRRQWAIINHQCSTIRRIYMNHIRLSRGSPSEIKYLDDFFDRYEDVTFDTAFIPFEFLNDFSVENLASPDDLFADPTLSEIFHSPVPSVGTPQIPNASPSNTTDGGSASSITHIDEYGNPRHTKRPKIHRHSSVSDGSTPLNNQHSPQDQYRMQTHQRLHNNRNSFHYPGQPPPLGPGRGPPTISIPENTPFDFTSPVMPNTAYSYDMNKYTFSPSGNYSFFSSTPYNNFFDFGMDPAVFSTDPGVVQEKDALPTELEPDPLMTLLSEMATREDGNSLDMFMGNPSGTAN
ncbi:hypothetical protein H072_3652 [Dactylellina haptotyla CBS 200.50]|uniref:Zn(2)-C6 fungal-type domain-containing protein n=1 Tax=Dactylellina haptotyla (strain CBS 200.50) TaxID=1284197 RepID=S8AMT5_DACHA|nr:hypothetical protein H072_3652 [Dactylellina haptotyla CBS 200.50]